MFTNFFWKCRLFEGLIFTNTRPRLLGNHVCLINSTLPSEWRSKTPSQNFMISAESVNEQLSILCWRAVEWYICCSHIKRGNFTCVCFFPAATLVPPFSLLSQTDVTLLANNSQHCWMLHVASVCTPCCMLLNVVGQSLKPVKLLAPGKRTKYCCVRLQVALKSTP